MLPLLASLASLLFGAAVLIAGHGLLISLVPIRIGAAGFSSQIVGIVATGYYVGLLAGAWYGPALIRRVGRVRAFAGFAALFSAATLGLPLLDHPMSWMALRTLAGACAAGLFITIESWLTSASPAHWRGRVLAAYMATFYMALGGGQFLLRLGDPRGPELFSIAAMLLALGLVPVALSGITAPPIERPRALSLLGLYRVSPLAVIGAFASGIIVGAFYGLAPLFGRNLGLTPGDVGLLMAVAIYGGLVLQWPMGHLSDRFDRRSVIIGVAALLAAAAVAIAVLGDIQFVFLLGLIAVLGGAVFTLSPLCLAHAADFLGDGDDMVSLSSGLMILFSVGAVVGPLAAAEAFDLVAGRGLFLVIAGAAAAVSLYGLWRMTRRAPVGTEAQVGYVAVPRSTPAVAGLDPRAGGSEPEFDFSAIAPEATEDEEPTVIDAEFESLPPAQDRREND